MDGYDDLHSNITLLRFSQGRVLHIIPARPVKQHASLDASVYTVRGKAGRLKRTGRTEQAGEESWMPSHIRGEVAATAAAKKLGIGKADLLGIKVIV